MANEDKRSGFFERKPNHEFRAAMSEDGKYYILKSIETWIVPVNYFKAIHQNHIDRSTHQGTQDEASDTQDSNQDLEA